MYTNGTFQSLDHRQCPAGKVPIPIATPFAHEVLWLYAQVRRPVDAEFATDLEVALARAGYALPRPAAVASVADHTGPHLVEGEFQSDKYPTCPRGHVPLSVKDPTAQPLLWLFAEACEREGHPSFADALHKALLQAGYRSAAVERWRQARV